jgi:hypothetical protein
MGLVVGKRPQQGGLGDAEHGDIRSDTDGQRKYRDDGESGASSESMKDVAQVL